VDLPCTWWSSSESGQCPEALYIRPVAKELNIDLGRWHDFRHTVATSMLRAGHGVKVGSELLGHSDVAITLRTYDHVESDAFRVPLNEAANQLL
jgi:integrase